jgi:RNA polymerase sigma-70 factor (ECF subfamily)
MATIAPTPPRSREGDEHVRIPLHAAAQADRHLLAALRRGDEGAFRGLVERHHAGMVRVARGFVPTHAVAEEVAQEAWLGVLDGLPRFEGRSSLRTWIFSILVKRAKTRGERERRTVPFSALVRRETDGEVPAVDPDRFLGLDDRWAGHWACGPKRFAEPAEWLAADETRALVRAAVDGLPPAQRTVISLRDLEGWDASEVSALLGISNGNQRVLLHRARAKVRTALEGHLDVR